jgi:hypothetical protein
MDHRSATWNLTADLMASGHEEQPPIHPLTESRCKICSAAERDLPNGAAVRGLVDDLLLIPRDYSAIMRTVAPLMADWPEELRFSRFALMRHARRHLRWEEAAFRAVADRRSRQAAKVHGASERMISAVVVYETIRQRGLDLLMQGEIKPSVRDMLAATSALQEIDDEDNAAISPALYYSQLDRVIQAIREEIPEERWDAVLARLDVDSADPPT